MRRQIISALVFGIGGIVILVSLGIWQVQRLAWKEAFLAEIAARIDAEPVSLPPMPDPGSDRFLPVQAMGTMGTDYVRVLVSQRGQGAGYRVISPLALEDGRIVMIDRGVMPTEAVPPVHTSPVTVAGNLHWPDEVDGFTPAPDVPRNIWYARDVEALAARLGTDPTLIIARALSVDDSPVLPLPVTTEGIPNDHLQYAVTWFSLALLWFGMTLYLLRRIRRRTV